MPAHVENRLLSRSSLPNCSSYQGCHEAESASTGDGLSTHDLKLGFPQLFANLEVVRAHTVDEAVRAASRPERANGNARLIATVGGDSVDVEVTGWR